MSEWFHKLLQKIFVSTLVTVIERNVIIRKNLKRPITLINIPCIMRKDIKTERTATQQVSTFCKGFFILQALYQNIGMRNNRRSCN